MTAVHTRISRNWPSPQRSPDLEADSDHSTMLDGLREDVPARHDVFSLIGRITAANGARH
jgi:hypothetical protein